MVTTSRLSIGLPVFNGEDYLEQAIESLLAQTYSDFEFVISDNASTDSTEDICRAYAVQDRRIKYHRNPKNIGAIQNWYRVLDLSSGEYMASAAHDDLYAADYMEKCIAVLDRDPSVIVCYSKTRIIDEHGEPLDDKRIAGMLETKIDTVSPNPSVRFYNAITVDHLCIQMYGVMRAKALRGVKVFAGYYGCDRNILAELALLGKMQEIPEHLFFHRIYPKALGAAVYSGRDLQELFRVDPGTDWKTRFPAFKVYGNYVSSVSQASIPFSEKVKSYFQLQRIIAGKVTGRVRRSLSRNHSG
jgi:glycosyltransferase involved in cell wall biosynthesis